MDLGDLLKNKVNKSIKYLKEKIDHNLSKLNEARTFEKKKESEFSCF
jgi:hypothetical protein